MSLPTLPRRKSPQLSPILTFWTDTSEVSQAMPIFPPLLSGGAAKCGPFKTEAPTVEPEGELCVPKVSTPCWDPMLAL